MARTVASVTPAKGGGWYVRVRGDTGAGIQHFTTKDPAVAEAKRLAKCSGLGQVVIHKMDGTIQEERTYGKDPRRSRG